MQFLRRSLVGLFLLAMTLGLLAFSANLFWGAVQDRRAQETIKRPARERIMAVNTTAIEPQTITPVLTAFGEVSSRRTLELRASASGRIVALADDFEDGAAVSAGQLLIRVDPTDFQAALDVARTDLAESESEVRDAERSLVLAQSETEAAEAQADLRTAALDRQKNLQTRGVGTAATVETAALSEVSARQAVLARKIAEASAENRVDQAKNQLSRSKIAVANAERALADTELRADFDGVLADVVVLEGGLLSANEQIATLIDPTSLEVTFRLSTTQYARLLQENGSLVNAPVRVTLDVLGLDLEASGSLSRVSASVGEGQTGRQIFARLDDFAGFRPGDFVTVYIDEPELADVIVLPATALDALNTVLVIGPEDRLEVASVELLRRQGDDVIVRAPDLTGRRVVAQRSPLVGPGIRVRDLSSKPQDVAGGPSAGQAGGDDKISLTKERREKLIAAVESNKRMPADAKERILAQLREETVPSSMVERIESRMGG